MDMTPKELRRWLGRPGVQKIADRHKITTERTWLILRGRIQNTSVLADLIAEAKAIRKRWLEAVKA